jgi:hypothetical protein
VNKVGAYPNEAPFRRSTLQKTPGITHKERLHRDKHPSLLRSLSKNQGTQRKKCQNLKVLGCKNRTAVPIKDLTK